MGKFTQIQLKLSTIPDLRAEITALKIRTAEDGEAEVELVDDIDDLVFWSQRGLLLKGVIKKAGPEVWKKDSDSYWK